MKTAQLSGHEGKFLVVFICIARVLGFLGRLPDSDWDWWMPRHVDHCLFPFPRSRPLLFPTHFKTSYKNCRRLKMNNRVIEWNTRAVPIWQQKLVWVTGQQRQATLWGDWRRKGAGTARLHASEWLLVWIMTLTCGKGNSYSINFPPWRGMCSAFQRDIYQL